MNPEKILYEGRIPFSAFHFSHNLLWILVLGWNIGLLSSYLARHGLHVKLTSQRVVLTRGSFARRVEEVEYYRVTDTTASQSIMQRLFGFGTITILSTDQSCGPPVSPCVSRKNMTTRPLGAQVGPSSSQPVVMMRAPEPFGAITPTWNPPL